MIFTRDLLPSNFFISHYFALIDRITSVPETATYQESHHIFPSSLFPGSTETISVSYKHHVILHYLLWRGLSVGFGSSDKRTVKMRAALHAMKVFKSSYQGKRMIDREHFRELAEKADSYEGYHREKTLEERKAYSDRMKACWADPEWRAARLLKNNTPESRKAKSLSSTASNLRRWAEMTEEAKTERLRNQGAAIRKAYKDNPELRERSRKAAKLRQEAIRARKAAATN